MGGNAYQALLAFFPRNRFIWMLQCCKCYRARQVRSFSFEKDSNRYYYSICHLTMRSAYTNRTIHLYTKRVTRVLLRTITTVICYSCIIPGYILHTRWFEVVQNARFEATTTFYTMLRLYSASTRAHNKKLAPVGPMRLVRSAPERVDQLRAALVAGPRGHFVAHIDVARINTVQQLVVGVRIHLQQTARVPPSSSKRECHNRG